jgi:hypothetical protein
MEWYKGVHVALHTCRALRTSGRILANIAILFWVFLPNASKRGNKGVRKSEQAQGQSVCGPLPA